MPPLTQTFFFIFSVSGNYQSQVWKEKNIQLIGTPSFGKIEFINEESGGSKPVKVQHIYLPCHEFLLKIIL